MHWHVKCGNEETSSYFMMYSNKDITNTSCHIKTIQKVLDIFYNYKIFKPICYNTNRIIRKGNFMQTVTLSISDAIYDKFFWLLKHFSKNEVTILEQSKFVSDDEYLRSIDGMQESLKASRAEPIENGVSEDKLDW